MIIPDINLLLYTYDSDSPAQPKAADWWIKCLSGTEPVGLAEVVIFGFIRIGTNPRVFRKPFTPQEAAQHVRSWLNEPPVQVLKPGSDHVERVLQLFEMLGSAGNLVTDAQLAALALEYGAVLHTADSDFLRFPGLRWFNPITGVSSGRVRRAR